MPLVKVPKPTFVAQAEALFHGGPCEGSWADVEVQRRCVYGQGFRCRKGNLHRTVSQRFALMWLHVFMARRG